MQLYYRQFERENIYGLMRQLFELLNRNPHYFIAALQTVVDQKMHPYPRKITLVTITVSTELVSCDLQMLPVRYESWLSRSKPATEMFM